MYDAIIVGARCAGSPTAMLLGRHGCKVLLVDRATFPSDTISTHILWPHGAEILARWGLLGTLAATGAPPICRQMTFDVGPFALSRSHSRRQRWHGRVLSASNRARQPPAPCSG
jgi:2-polyprenyl-6-methoxyphenol hydroxylase-like FAD-dependent oxidoreductase